MVQYFPVTSKAQAESQAGTSLGQGIAKNFQPPEQRVQQQLLSQAMSKLGPNTNLVDFVKEVGPQLMTTPGGPQLLSELAPLIQKQAAATGYQNYLAENQPAEPQPAGLSRSAPGGAGVSPSGEVTPSGEEYFRNPQPPEGKQGTYPKQSVDPQPVQLMTPDEINSRIRQLMREQQKAGVDPDPMAARQVVMKEQEMRMLNNQQVEAERQARETKQESFAADGVRRFKGSEYEKRDGDDVIFEQFLNEAKDAPNANAAYKHAETKFKQFETARKTLLREDNPGAFDRMARKFQGTYKDKEQIKTGVRPAAKTLVDLGLVDQARDLLSDGGIGFGAEDVEDTLFPLNKTQKSELNAFPPNKYYGQPQKPSLTYRPITETYPGAEASMPEKEFQTFKQDLGKFLNKNPGVNLIGLRGILNQDKKYAWTDFQKAISELNDEGGFQPDSFQRENIPVINQGPMPGFLELFKEFWWETK